LKPKILITAGDPLGIGPEVAVKAAASPAVRRACLPCIAGDTAALIKAGWTPYLCPLLPVDAAGRDSRRPRPTAAGGEASLKAVLLGIKLVKQGGFAALVTAPISKESWAMARAPQPAHTDLFRALEHTEPLMLFTRGRVNAALATEHLPIKDLHRALTKELVIQKALLFAAALKAVGLTRPRLTICALNPHAGDGGVIGREEIDTLIPAVKALRGRGLRISGPAPADAAWAAHLAGKSDGLLALYHDQALVPLKTAPGAGPAVHWTWGLPFIRTSPAHGTAFDIAGRGKADPSGMKEAVLFAVKLIK